MEEFLITILVIIGAFIISALPLYFAVKLLRGRASILKVILVNVLVGAILGVISWLFGAFAGIIGFIVMLLLYKVFFHMGWLRSFVAWLLQLLFTVLLVFLVGGLFGLSLFF